MFLDSFAHTLNEVIGLDQLLSILIRTVIMFIAVLIFFRLTGKKELGEVSVLDVIITLMIAELAVVLIDDPELPLYRGLAPIALLILLQRIFTYLQVKNQKFRDLVDGEPVIIIKDGQFLQKNLSDQNYNIDDIMLQLRDKNIADVQEVDWAMLEASGTLSIFKKGDNAPFTLPLIMDGVLQTDHLNILNLTEEWVHEQLNKKGIVAVEHVFYCSYFNNTFAVQKKIITRS
ncbi:DUF421 domain-containing protein [Bacillus sp. C1-1]|uniref:DUF421 domain-containing protein n=1 Tax=Shouchella lehensis TaxID=300825 RepID=A0A4Y7WG44_9BACI|nr:hypothetical protein [Shouchella lehensis]RQW19005.1 DUF421 domain-containing protein [Bacillus sp. C1-1]TES46718.1 DUF421 domain-containing protein [Shouchella lehensis]